MKTLAPRAALFALALALGFALSAEAGAQCKDTIAVTTTADDTANNGVTSLREAIEEANAEMSSCDTRLIFELSSAQRSADGHYVFRPTTDLPVITGSVLIDGWDVTVDGMPTSPIRNTAAPFQPGTSRPLIEIQGRNSRGRGLQFRCILPFAGRSKGIRGVVFNGFTEGQVNVEICEDLVIAGNHFGTDRSGNNPPSAGTNAQPSQNIQVNGADRIQIGGPTRADRNVFAPGSSTSIFLWRQIAGATIEGNFIGVGQDGDPIGQDTTYGVWASLASVSDVTVRDNWIQGGLVNGVLLEGASTGHLLANNRIVGSSIAAVAFDPGIDGIPAQGAVTYDEGAPPAPALTSAGLAIDLGGDDVPSDPGGAVDWVRWATESTVEGTLPAGNIVDAALFGSTSCEGLGQGEVFLGSIPTGTSSFTATYMQDGSPAPIPTPFVSAFVVEDVGGALVTHEFSTCLSAPPVVEPPEDQIIAASGTTVSFIATDLQTATQELAVDASSDNAFLFADAALTPRYVDGVMWELDLVPIAGRTGQATITLEATDGNGSTTTATFTVDVRSPPVLTLQPSAVGNEDTPIGVAPNSVTDVDSGALSVEIEIDRGTFSLNQTLELTFAEGDGVEDASMRFSGEVDAVDEAITAIIVQPPPDETGFAELTVRVSDERTTVSATSTITINGTNDRPVAVDDTISLDEDTLLTLSDGEGLLSNDEDVDGDALEVDSFDVDATVAAVEVSPGGGVTIDPREVEALQSMQVGDETTDTFTYVASDGNGGTDNATVTVTIVGVNDAPTLAPLEDQSTPEDTPLEVAVTVGDVDDAPGSLTLSAASVDAELLAPEGIAVGGEGASRTLTLTPVADATGEVLVTLTVGDGDATSQASFTLSVIEESDPPVIGAIAAVTTAEDTPSDPVTFTVSDPDTPLGDLTLEAEAADPSLVAEVTFGGSGGERTVAVTPAPDQVGSTTVTVTLGDGFNTTTGEFELEVTPVNDPPTFAAPEDLTMSEDTSSDPIALEVADLETAEGELEVRATSSDTGLVDEDGLEVAWEQEAGWTLVITPLPDQFGEATITLEVEDADGATAEASFALTVEDANEPPEGQDDAYTVAGADLPLVVAPPGVLGNDADPEGSDLTAVLTSTVDPGELRLDPDGGFSFDVSPSFSGVTAFTYRANDGTSNSPPITVTITVEATDSDGDSVPDATDNCLDADNPEQSDIDGDGLGDECDDDIDGDGVPGDDDCNDVDADVAELRTFYADDDGDGIGDADNPRMVCGDMAPAGFVDTSGDLCPSVALDEGEHMDLDEDGVGDACDEDIDGDGVPEDGDGSGEAGDALCGAEGFEGTAESCDDNCPTTPNADQADTDMDGLGDACADDEDGDGITLELDGCPEVPGTLADFGCPPSGDPPDGCGCRQPGRPTSPAGPLGALTLAAAVALGLARRR